MIERMSMSVGFLFRGLRPQTPTDFVAVRFSARRKILGGSAAPIVSAHHRSASGSLFRGLGGEAPESKSRMPNRTGYPLNIYFSLLGASGRFAADHSIIPLSIAIMAAMTTMTSPYLWFLSMT